MRASVASLSKKLLSTFFAATLVMGLVPAAALAVDEEGEGAQAYPEIITNTVALEEVSNPTDGNVAPEEPALLEGDAEEGVVTEKGEGGASLLANLAGEVISQDMPLEPVA